ncbi:hypothetical protein PTSG_08662 [Salpingoeca rosetta]|uniref:Cleavage and polyadenylation specificity factor subunit 5 n=1 Tax=Salpingoeca rosetta (strain ATCC 50818 / BSB-021) TaxID=946362 RepID=F2UKB5_SALR5|nr:uncharacterized protein PTSG_08662 [Salpingoeca rosetta]EGD77564.1 hypothetical protein PTSG_08662 [Salpingoeca rosetta]|eukprot:XP_004990452.1 hypothetical protein PTSG_08662 [Salpingoeca rosetta]
MAFQHRHVDIFPNSNYKILKDDSKTEPKSAMDEKLMALMHKFNETGLVETMQLVMLVEQHGHPHVLLLQPHPKFSLLPHTEIKPDETSKETVHRILQEQFQVAEPALNQFRIVDLAAVWWRPHFEQPTYPYQPPHVTKPKERIQVVLVQMPESCDFVVPGNGNVRAVPLIELYDNKESFGQLIATLPQTLSRYDVEMHKDDFS